jgi:hypothetical protein
MVIAASLLSETDHRNPMSKFGFTRKEIDSALVVEGLGERDS